MITPETDAFYERMLLESIDTQTILFPGDNRAHSMRILAEKVLQHDGEVEIEEFDDFTRMTRTQGWTDFNAECILTRDASGINRLRRFGLVDYPAGATLWFARYDLEESATETSEGIKITATDVTEDFKRPLSDLTVPVIQRRTHGLTTNFVTAFSAARN